MNNTFSLKRFGKYFLYDFKTQCSNMGIFMLILALFPVVFYMLYMFLALLLGGNLLGGNSGIPVQGPSIGFRFGMLAAIGFAFVMIFPAKTYGVITDKQAGSYWLMLPASRTEKYASMMIISLILMPLLFFFIFFVSDAAVCLIDKTCGDALVRTRLTGERSVFGANEGTMLEVNSFLLLTTFIIEYVMVFLLGSVIFKKHKAGKTILALIIIGIASSFLFSTIFKVFFANTDIETLNAWIEQFVKRLIEKHYGHLDVIFNIYLDFCLLAYLSVCGIWIWFRVKKLQH